MSVPAAFAVPVRLGVFEDERGVHVSMVNPLSVKRTIVAEQGMVIFGVSGAAMETKAFGIVGAGEDDVRSGFSCPGLAYAAAFPVEAVVRRDGAQVRVEAIDAMFRMKMYFEDAGQMKFARNMMMPGSIADELNGIVRGETP